MNTSNSYVRVESVGSVVQTVRKVLSAMDEHIQELAEWYYSYNGGEAGLLAPLKAAVYVRISEWVSPLIKISIAASSTVVILFRSNTSSLRSENTKSSWKSFSSFLTVNTTLTS